MIKKQEGIRDFDLVLVIFFNGLDTSDLVKKLRDDLLPVTSSWCDPYAIDNLLSQLRVLWILDGVEDATRDAEMLMKSLVQRQHDNHTILITSRSAYAHTLSAKFPDKKMLDIILDGADPMEMLEKFIRCQNSTTFNQEDVEKLKQKFRHLHIDIKRELQNPLKMQFVLEDFKSENFNPNKKFNLTGLYQMHKEQQIKSLARKNTIGKVNEREAHRKIEKWFLLLCKLTYAKVCDTTIFTNYIDMSAIEMLEKECDNLGLYSSECLSTFLTHTQKCSSQESIRYAFYHSTQQYFLTAMYIASEIKDSPDVKSDLLKLFGISSDQNIQYAGSIHLYEVLVQLTVLLGGDVDEKTTNALVTVIDHVLPKVNIGQRLFEIIHAVSSNQAMLKHIAKLTPDFWFLINSQIEGAMSLLQFCRPRCVHLNLLTVMDTHTHSLVLDFLRKLADLPDPVYLKLTILYFNSEDGNTLNKLDSYLEELCHKKSQAS